jgi:hypothetical protein
MGGKVEFDMKERTPWDEALPEEHSFNVTLDSTPRV